MLNRGGALFKDEDVIAWRKMAREDIHFNLAQFASSRKLSESTVSRCIRGETYGHLNTIAPPITRTSARLGKKAEARRLYREEKKSYNEIVKILDVAKSSVSLWCRDLVVRVDAPTKPKTNGESVKRISEEKRLAARALCQEGKSYKEISKIVGVGHSTVSKYCHDIVAERAKVSGSVSRRLHRKRDYKAPKTITGNLYLTDDTVVDMRREAREKRCMNLNHYAKKYNAHISAISCAMRGRTFRHVNHREPPITERYKIFIANPVTCRKLDDAILDEAIALARYDQAYQTYVALATWLSEKTGRTYRPNTVATLFKKHAPDVALKGKETVSTPRVPKAPALTEREKYALRVQKNERRRERVRKERDELQTLIEQEERYERWVAAGCPAE